MTEPKFQYRVVWVREGREWPAISGGAMIRAREAHKDKPSRRVKVCATLKAAERHRLILLGRGFEAYGFGPDEDCDCYQGPTHTRREHFDRKYADLPPLIGEPVIEQREVGEWVPSTQTR